MNEVVIRGALGCADVLANGAPGQVLTVLADGTPGWAAGAAGGGGVDLCNLAAAEIACLAAALRGELVTDAFGVSLGYLLVG